TASFATKTKTGLNVQAQLDKVLYPTKVKVSDEELATVQIPPHEFHGEWNYTISPNLNIF
ncbi:MAG: ISAzo13-like element transposase-related protein, partial [Nostoc sp.]